jgi:hypothetical protein
MYVVFKTGHKRTATAPSVPLHLGRRSRRVAGPSERRLRHRRSRIQRPTFGQATAMTTMAEAPRAGQPVAVQVESHVGAVGSLHVPCAASGVGNTPVATGPVGV